MKWVPVWLRVLAVLALLLVGGLVLFSRLDRGAGETLTRGEQGGEVADEAGAREVLRADPEGVPRPAAFPKQVTLLPIAAEAEQLDQVEGTAGNDLALIGLMLDSYRKALGSNPVGFNDEITAALTGLNAKGAAVLPAGHAKISADGELLDRWGTPYRFHALSSQRLEVISAGPDQRFFTEDDVSSDGLE